jgi:hypothetical protein
MPKKLRARWRGFASPGKLETLKNYLKFGNFGKIILISIFGSLRKILQILDFRFSLTSKIGFIF